MLKKLFSLFTNNVFVIVLLVVVGAISVSNYSSGTILSGWDTLHPEFDFPLAFKRAFQGVWREEQGLGTLAGHSHMSELPRIFLLWISSVVFPLNLIRYVWVFFTLGMGTLGTYYFSQNIFNTKKLFGKVASFLGALYYLLNLGTVQNYYVPFEMFTVLFAMLPWLYLYAFRYLKTKEKKDLIVLTILSIFAAPMAYAATLFYAYLGSIFLYMSILVLLTQKKLETFKRMLIVLVVLVTTNSFWLLPNVYSIKFQSEVVANSRINTLFSQEAFLSNEAFGDIRNVIIHKNFLFSWQEHDAGKDSFVELMDEWNEYLDKSYVQYFLYFSAAVVVTGLIAALVTRNSVGIALVFPTVFALFFLINNNWPTAKLYSLLLDQSSLVEEGFRMPFTKFSILFMFFSAFYFSYAVKTIISVFEKIKLEAFVSGILVILLSGILVGGVLPVFEGHLISPSMRTQIPQEYFDLQAYMKTQPQGRVAILPIHTLYGWTYYDWDYEGGGPSFMPFLIPQSLLMRDYDRWSPYNESFYNEASFHFYQKDLNAFEKVLQKYAIDYILIDKSAINPTGDENYLLVSEAEQMFADSSFVEKAAEFGNLEVYKTSISSKNAGLEMLTNYSHTQTEARYASYDAIYQTYGDYVASDSFVYPFVNFDSRNTTKIERSNDKVVITQNFAKPITNNQILFPDFAKTEEWLSVDITMNLTEKGNLRVILTLAVPEIVVNGKNRVVSEPIQQTHFFAFPKNTVPSYISIEEEVIPVPSLDSSEHYIGSALIKNDTEVSLKFFTSDKEQLDEVSKAFYQSKSRWCSQPDKADDVNLKNGEFTITANEESMCWGEGLTLNENTYVQIQYEARSTDGLLPWICISEVGKDGCVNKNIPDDVVKEGEWGRFTYDVSLPIGNYWVVFVVQDQEGGPTSVTYRNVTFSAYKQLDEVRSYIGSSLKIISQEKLIDLNEPITSIRVEIPIRNVVSEDFTWLRGHPLPFNCERTGSGVVTKEAGNNSVVYGAYGNASSCDYFDYLNLSYQIGYLLSISGVNHEGRSLKFYLQNRNNGHIDLEELINRGEFYEQYVVLPRNIPGKGYVINFETRSFGRINSVNEISDISFIPLPLTWLYQVRLIPKSEKMQVNSSSHIIDSHRRSSYLYTATIATADSDGIVRLNQGYEDGWVGYGFPTVENGQSQLKSDKTKLSWIKSTFPFFFGKKLEHVKVNGWANGWLVENSLNQTKLVETGANKLPSDSSDTNLNQLQPVSTDSNQTIVIVYWPQYLEYAGFLLLLLTGAGLLFPWNKIKKQKEKRDTQNEDNEPVNKHSGVTSKLSLKNIVRALRKIKIKSPETKGVEAATMLASEPVQFPMFQNLPKRRRTFKMPKVTFPKIKFQNPWRKPRHVIMDVFE